MHQAPTIVWFRQDLRLVDHPGLCYAAQSGEPVLPVYVWAPEELAPWMPGAASRWWLHQSLVALDQDLGRLGSRLILRKGSTEGQLLSLCRETGARRVVWSRSYDPASRAQEEALRVALGSQGVQTDSFNTALLLEPGEVLTRSGGPFKVFTPFYRAAMDRLDPPPPLSSPKALAAPSAWPTSDPIESIGLLPRIDWAAGLRERWRPGREGVERGMETLSDTVAPAYEGHRDRPDLAGTSRLSPHLHFGEVGPRQLWHHLRSAHERASGGAVSFIRQLIWREFAHHLLHYFPESTDAPFQEAFERFPWREDAEALRAWQRGRTGYPIVDAGMRELWNTGWMHNRVRMIVASFLVKDLLVPWQRGAEWFWDTLVDADLANNTLGWQWTTGCGVDAAPYFRIFNPILQGRRFDPEGGYVRRWLPELTKVPDKWIHNPWEAPAAVLSTAGARLGRDYPEPIVNHTKARDRALAAYQKLKKKG